MPTGHTTTLSYETVLGSTAIFSRVHPRFTSTRAQVCACAAHGTRTAPVKRCTEAMDNL